MKGVSYHPLAQTASPYCPPFPPLYLCIPLVPLVPLVPLLPCDASLHAAIRLLLS
jgi:hypothetical protein